MKPKICRHPSAFTLIEIMLVVSLISVFLAISVCNVMRARNASQAITCINNLRQIESACQQLAIEKNLGNGATINFPQDVLPFIKAASNGSIPGCPAGGSYSLLPVGEPIQAQCSLKDNPHYHALN